MTTLNEALLQLAGDLKDDAPGAEFTSYPRELLLSWWNDAVCILARLRPDLFSSTRVVTLKPGSEQTIEGCQVFGKVIAQVNDDGTESPVRKTNYVAHLAWTKPACKTSVRAYLVTSYRFDSADKRTFFVEPPVPPGRTVRVKVVCSGAPAKLSITDLNEQVDLDCYQFALAKHYVLAMAYAQDSDQTNLQLAQFHLQLWNGFLVAGARADASFSGVPQAASQPQAQVSR